jgi:membrane protease YdiL (CAAX protease family)
MRKIVLVVLCVAAANAFAFRPELAASYKFWLGVGLPYLALAGLALHYLWDQGTLVDKLRPRWGDLSIGAVTAMLLLFGSWAGRAVLAPIATPRHAWLLRIYLQVGDTDAIQRSIPLTLVVLAIPILEELVWRGLVLSELEARLGSRRAWPLAALLYALAHVPTVFTLSDPIAGPNPLLATAALGCGIVWSFSAVILKRLPPVMFSHMAFTYFTVVQFRWPGT